MYNHMYQNMYSHNLLVATRVPATLKQGLHGPIQLHVHVISVHTTHLLTSAYFMESMEENMGHFTIISGLLLCGRGNTCMRVSVNCLRSEQFLKDVDTNMEAMSRS